MSLYDVFYTSTTFLCLFRLKKIDEYVEKFLEEFNEQVQNLSADEFQKFVSCFSFDINHAS